MTKQEAIEILNKNAPKSDPRLCALELCSAIHVVTLALQEKDHRCDNCSNGENAEGKNVFEIIEAQPQASGWIPVTEKLPENGCGVLVTVNGKHNNIIFVNALEIAEYRNTEGWIIEGYLDWLDPNVTAWMPLPEPYKESKEE